MKDRTDLICLGRIIGTCTGWDQNDTESFTFYDFEPVAGLGIEAAKCIGVDFGKGILGRYTDDGKEVASVHDLVELVKDLPKVQS